jgi:Protein of unknown function (Hypoth_ymh)
MSECARSVRAVRDACRRVGVMAVVAGVASLCAAAVVDEAGVDAELWRHIAPEVAAEAWGKVASPAVIFTEDRIRRWARRPVSEVGKELAVGVFGKRGQFQMGQTESENQGWQLYAQGIAQALRNVDAHRVQERPDHKRYAMGLLGACSRVDGWPRRAHLTGDCFCLGDELLTRDPFGDD